MERIKPLIERDEESLGRLLAVWESSVRATHSFLSEDDIQAIKPDVKPALLGIEELYSYYGDDDLSLGFIGVEKGKIEMLFVAPPARGRGVGGALLNFAVRELAARYVDVNEQNKQAFGFYLRMGFCVIGRDDLDGQGRPFPLLHMKIEF